MHTSYLFVVEVIIESNDVQGNAMALLLECPDDRLASERSPQVEIGTQWACLVQAQHDKWSRDALS